MSTIRVALVEDERIVALHLRQIFTKLGYEVVSVSSNGTDALAKIIDLKPDVVFMDIRIEGDWDGIETASRIPEDLNIPVIYLSAYSEEVTLQRASGTKPYGYLLKPFTERELHSTVIMALERRRVEQILRDTQERVHLAMGAGELGYWELEGSTGQFVCVEPLGSAVSTGANCATWDDFLSGVWRPDRQRVSDALDRTKQDDELIQVEFRRAGPDGPRWLRAQGRAFPRDDGDDCRIVGVVQDITVNRQIENHLRLGATVFQSSPNGILILDEEQRVIGLNRSYTDITGLGEAQVVGTIPDFLDGCWVSIEGHSRRETTIVGADGQAIPVLVTLSSIADTEVQDATWVVIVTDLSAIRQVQAEREHFAHYDSLTDLPNRFLALDRLDHSLRRSNRDGTTTAVLFVDVDHFKRVNDTLGHSIGDAVLRVMSCRMKGAVRASDTVARLGGDEFMVILECLEGAEDAEKVASQIVAELAKPVSIENLELDMTASIGIALFPKDAKNGEDLIRAADTAMYVAKESGRNAYSFYCADMQTRTAQSLARVGQLRTALRSDQLVLHFQPQINLETQQVCGVEALVRWNHPDHGLLGAGEVVPLAEANGLIEELGQWVIAEAGRHVRLWREMGLPSMRIAVNVAPAQMRRGRLIESVRRVLTDYAVPPSLLEIEVTESMLQNERDCIASLQELRRMGVATAIDDFGTGFSCLSSLKVLPIDRLKVDQAFVRDIPQDRNDAAITEAIVVMARSLGLRVIAEGVETQAQLDFLKQRQCHEVQGFLLARPMGHEALVRWLDERGRG